MATLNFPDSPDTGDIYFDSNSGFTYEWNGSVWISRDPSRVDNIKELDNISSSFNGSTTTFNLTVSSAAVSPATAQQLIINIGNVMQNPGDDYTVSGSTITFTTAPLAGYVFQGTLLGSSVPLVTVGDGTVSPSSLDTTDSYNVGGITVTGITTVTDFTISGITTVANLEPSDVNVSGIGTVANIIMTKDAAGLGATIGSAVGVVTYIGDGSNLTGSGVGATMYPFTYSPADGATSVALTPTINTTWNTSIQAGSGTITIRTGSSSGTIIDQFVVGSSSSITIAGDSLTITPATSIAEGTEVFVVYPAGSIQSLGGQLSNLELVTKFTTLENRRYFFMAGYNAKGQMAQNDMDNSYGYSSPIQIGNEYNWAKWSTADGNPQTVMATKKDGTLWLWGVNETGGLGQNQAEAQLAGASSPVQVGTDTTWGTVDDEDGKFMVNGSTSSFAIKTDGTLWAWGNNTGTWAVKLGLNDEVERSSPTQVGTDTNWKSLAAANRSAIATKTDGTLWAWGNNHYGSLGQNTDSGNPYQNNENARSSPTQIGTGTDWNRVIMSGAAVKTDGSLWRWGSNFNGQLGINQAPGDLAAVSSPVQIPGTWPAAQTGSSGPSGFYGVKSDGTAWVWGSNTDGVLGLNEGTPARKSSPTQLGTDTNWKQLVRQSTRSWAVKTDGSLWSWGYYYTGARGLNQAAYQPNPALAPNYSSPVQVGTETDWIELGEGTTYINLRAVKETD